MWFWNISVKIDFMEGGCHCGAIRFKTKSDPKWIGACYCVDCRKISGTPYTVFVGYDKDTVELLRGNPKEYKSSKHVIRTFCETCSAPFSYVYVDTNEDSIIFIPAGMFDDPASLEPHEHIWVSQRLSWVHINDDLPQRER